MKAKYEFQLNRFRNALKQMKEEDRDEFEKIMRAVLPIWINTAAKYSPPDIKRNIDPIRYEDGELCLTDERGKTYGRRRIYDLLESVQQGVCRKPEFGKMLKQGFRYLVYPKKGCAKFCRTLEEAKRYAHISYRGLFRASWGLAAARVAGKIPGAITALIQKRPDLSKQSALNEVTFDKVKIAVSVTNKAIPDGIGQIAANQATYAATNILLQRIEKYFLKKVPF